MDTTKVCTKCGAVKPQSEFRWRDKAAAIRHRHCAACAAITRHRRIEAATDPAPIAEKTCTKCRQTKPVSGFSLRLDASDGWQSQCNECRRLNCDRWNRRNRERQCEAAKAYYLANVDKVREYNQTYREKNADYYTRYNAEWGRANLDKGRARRTKRRATLLRAMPSWADQTAILAVYAEAVARRLDVDHIVPLQSKIVCGLHVPWNLQLLTKAENTAKLNRHWPDMP